MSNQLDATFDTPEPIDLYVENGRGLVDVTATDTTETTVRITGERAEEFDVRDLGDRIAIIAPKGGNGFFGRDSRAEILVEVPVASGLNDVRDFSPSIRNSDSWRLQARDPIAGDDERRIVFHRTHQLFNTG